MFALHVEDNINIGQVYNFINALSVENHLHMNANIASVNFIISKLS